MRAKDLINTMLVHPDFCLVVELPNRQRIPVKRYRHGENARGEPVIVLEVGKRKH